MCWKFAWNITGAMVVDSRLNLEQHCGLLAEFHQNSPWIHSCYMLLSFGDNSDDVTTTEHECGAAIGRRLLQNFWGYGSGQVSFRKLQKSTSCRCWRKFDLIVFIRTKLRNNPRCQELIFSRLDARTLSTARNAHVEMQHAQSRSKEKRGGNPGGQIQINT